MRNYKFDLSRNISGGLALIIVMALSVFVAWFSLKAARNIVDSADFYYQLNIDKRIK
ncbi:MAG: hypothetical protein WC906_02045 [Parcubacteria group bacterium]|jgi:hypothetical protein